MEATIRKRRLLRTTVAAVLALGLMAGCDDDGSDETDGTTTETLEIPRAEIEVAALRECLKRETGAVGTPGKDALLANYANEAVAEGGGTFVIPDPLAHVIVFSDQVDVQETQQQLRSVAEAHGIEAVGMQGDAYGNVLIVYFEGAPADKAPATKCLGGEAVPIPGFETPLDPRGPGETEGDDL